MDSFFLRGWMPHIYKRETQMVCNLQFPTSPVSLSQNMTQPQTNCNIIYLYGIMYIDYLQITRKNVAEAPPWGN